MTFLLFVCYFGQATFLTLWAGSVFNTRPKCEDPTKGEGSTLAWCDALSVVVGIVDIVVVVVIMVCFVYIKVKAMSVVAGGVPAVPMAPVGSGTKKRRLSSRELMIEMASPHLQTNIEATKVGEGEVKHGGEGGEGGSKVKFNKSSCN